MADARQKTEDYVQRRTAMAEQKIALAETEAVNEVRRQAIDIAVAAAETLIADKVDDKKAGALISESVAELKAKLN